MALALLVVIPARLISPSGARSCEKSMRRKTALMKRFNQMLSAGLMIFVMSAGAFALYQKKDDRKIPPKDNAPTVPVTPKKPPDNNNKGGKGDRRGRP
jgi:hypothetical protein